MQQNSGNISYLIGNEEIIDQMHDHRADIPFSEMRIEFLNLFSKYLMADKESRNYPDVITLAFWCRKGSMEKQKERFSERGNSVFRLGRGIAFHIAPSNVAVNYAYSFVVGFITGNANIVRIPSKDYPQINIINRNIKNALLDMPELAEGICFVRYGRETQINDRFSAMADIRIIWGGDITIGEIRKSALRPRATEITFADRYSLCVIDSDAYLRIEDKDAKAKEFYNDTYLSDQNACTSPRIILWMGKEKERAKELFWEALYKKVAHEYPYQEVQGVNKLTSLCLLAAEEDGVCKIPTADNRLVRIHVEHLSEQLMEYRDNSGYFLEYDMEQIEEMLPLCNDRVQTVSYIGDSEIFYPLVKKGIRGIDRIVPVGRTMDFDLIWDGYDLVERLTRRISIL